MCSFNNPELTIHVQPLRVLPIEPDLKSGMLLIGSRHYVSIEEMSSILI